MFGTWCANRSGYVTTSATEIEMSGDKRWEKQFLRWIPCKLEYFHAFYTANVCECVFYHAKSLRAKKRDVQSENRVCAHCRCCYCDANIWTPACARPFSWTCEWIAFPCAWLILNDANTDMHGKRKYFIRFTFSIECINVFHCRHKCDRQFHLDKMEGAETTETKDRKGERERKPNQTN